MLSSFVTNNFTSNILAKSNLCYNSYMKLAKKHFAIITLGLFLSLAFVTPVLAQTVQGSTSSTGATAQGSTTQGSTTGGSANGSQVQAIKLVNPLGSTRTLPELIDGILRIVLTIGIPVIALMIIYSGFKFVMAQGNPKELEEARRNLLYVLIGAGILLGAYVIAEAVVGTINAIRT